MSTTSGAGRAVTAPHGGVAVGLLDAAVPVVTQAPSTFVIRGGR